MTRRAVAYPLRKPAAFAPPSEKQGASSCGGLGRGAVVASSQEEQGAFLLP